MDLVAGDLGPVAKLAYPVKRIPLDCWSERSLASNNK